MARNRYSARKFKPHRSTVGGLIYKRCYRCPKCGSLHDKAPPQCICGGIKFTHFHSRAEAKRYATLLLLQDLGKISNLRKQVWFPLHTTSPDGLIIKVCDYVADFEYDDENGKRVVEDVKGGLTAVAELKLKWFERQYGFKPLITKG